VLYIVRILLVAVSLFATMSAVAGASTYPDRFVTLIVNYAAGGGTDILARFLAAELSEKWGQRVIIENRPGASGALGAERLARATPDGYTLGMLCIPDTVNSGIRRDLRFNIVEDFEPITHVAVGTNVLVINPKLPAKTLEEFIAYAKEKSGALNMAILTATSMHLDTVRINNAAGIKMGMISYNGSGPALTDVMGGHVDANLVPLTPAIPYIQSGALRGLAVTSGGRSEFLPEIPAVSETIPGFASDVWYGIAAPRNTPRDIVAKINRDLHEILRKPEVIARLKAMGLLPALNSPEEFRADIARNVALWRDIALSAGIRGEEK
jgi:tripartite-type tricarboxylate transporter receptor subunit TctC